MSIICNHFQSKFKLIRNFVPDHASLHTSPESLMFDCLICALVFVESVYISCVPNNTNQVAYYMHAQTIYQHYSRERVNISK